MIDTADPELTVYGHLFNMSANKINRVINIETKRVEGKPRKTGCLTDGLLMIAPKIAELSANMKAKKALADKAKKDLADKAKQDLADKAKKDLADKAKAPVVDSNLPSV